MQESAPRSSTAIVHQKLCCLGSKALNGWVRASNTKETLVQLPYHPVRRPPDATQRHQVVILLRQALRQDCVWCRVDPYAVHHLWHDLSAQEKPEVMLSTLGCALLQESPEFPGIRRNLGSKKRELRSFFAGTSRKGRTDREGTLKNTFLFCRNIKIRQSRDL